MTEASNNSTQTVALWARRWGLDIYRYCRKLLASDSEAEDAMQLVFLQAIQDFPRFRGPATERHWLLSIARHRCLDRLKLLRRLPEFPGAPELEELEVPASGPGADDALAASEAARVLARCIEELPAPTRAAVVLRYHDQLSYERIEAEMGVSAGALRVRVLRGLSSLRGCLERQGVPW